MLLCNLTFDDIEHSLEWWSFELLILLSGLLPNPELETSVLSIWYNKNQTYINHICLLHFIAFNFFLSS